ncbi:MAG TPA: hypothetical protein VN222_04215, partial [Novosphingobium sp.]|nr:hypothetical protein [Novosphingobium sp.]
MPFLLALLPVLAQIGAAPSLGLPMIDRPTKPNIRKQPIIILPTPAGPLQTCLDAAGENPAAGEKIARAWIARGDKESAASRAQGHLCLGTALANQDQWDNARLTFAAGMNIAMPDDHMLRAELGAMAGDAALTAGDAG